MKKKQVTYLQLVTSEKVKRTKWLKPGSPAHLAIHEVISDPKLLKDLHQVTNACQTAELESFHSLLTKYSPKRQEFDYDVMLARSQLVIMDHNHNVNRNQVITSKPSAQGKEEGEQQFRFAFSKATKEWQAKALKESKSYEFIYQLMTDATEKRRSGPKHSAGAASKSKLLPKNIAKIPTPPKEQLIKKRLKRITKSE